MNDNQFTVLGYIHANQPTYLRKIETNTQIPYGTIQSVVNQNLEHLEFKEEGKQKYISFKKDQNTEFLLKQLAIEQEKRSLDQTQDRLEQLEAQSVYIIREAFANFKNMCMLWSIGKDSTVLLWLARKAFAGHVPFPLVHIDTNYKLPEMIQYRDSFAKKWNLNMIYGQNTQALQNKETFPDGKISRIECCKRLKTQALQNTLNGTWPRFKLNHANGEYEEEVHKEAFTGVIVGARSDEEGSRSKERYFSPRNKDANWAVEDQPPEFWNQFNTEFEPGTHLRIHPLLDWTELDVWKYIQKEKIPIIDLYFDKGSGRRFRSLGCGPCTSPIHSTAKNVSEIIAELESGKLRNIAERSGREQDKEGDGLETLRKGGYM